VKLLRTLNAQGAEIKTLAFAPEGRTLATGSQDNTVKLWDAHTGKLLRTLKGHQDWIWGVAFDPAGRTLVSGGEDATIKLWHVPKGELLHTLKGHQKRILGVAFDHRGEVVASASEDNTVKLWEARSGTLLRTLDDSQTVLTVAFDPLGITLASAGNDDTAKLWEVRSGKLLRVFEGHSESVCSVAFDPVGRLLASASGDTTVKLWEARSGKLLRTLEGHTATVEVIRFSPNGLLLASKSQDGTIRVWKCETWETIAVIPMPTRGAWIPALGFHPTLPLLASVQLDPESSDDRGCKQIQFWELDFGVLIRKRTEQLSTPSAVHHTTGKIVLLGDHSVGKSALGYRLIHGRFEKQESTHGQKFWVFPQLGQTRVDGTECEAILWDFAGQPDYRLVHALFVDNADLALVLFDASDLRDPLHGVEFWLTQLNADAQQGGAAEGCPIILVAAQTDRGTCSLTAEELDVFCSRHGIVGPITTSAFTGLGMEELVERMKSLICWEDKPATVTTTTFKRIKDYVLGLKEGDKTDRECIVTPRELRRQLEATGEWDFSDSEMLTAVGHLENYGYAKRLRTSKGELRILLEPERLNNLASSFVLEARRNPKGLGALEERRLLAAGYDFPELRDLPDANRDMLLDSAALLFLEHNVCFRETDPLRMESYLVFPELINLKKPTEEETATEDSVAYTVSGPMENVFASLVVLLGYTHTFTRTAQWHNNARYEVGDGLVCGFRQEAERDGELDFVLCFGRTVGAPVRTLFQGLFESFMARRNLTVVRYEPVKCSKGHQLNRSVVREAMQHGDDTSFCSRCGEQLKLPKTAERIHLTKELQAEVQEQRHAAEQRTRFEQAVFRVRAYVAEQKIRTPECFISYAWGMPEHERWVEKRLATDLQKAGITVLLDRWNNVQIGSSITRFVERIEDCGRVIVVGTPLYRQKAKNVLSTKGSVVAAEWDVAGIRMLATETQKRTVLPVLLAGDEAESFPPLLRGRVYGDFRQDESYFRTAFDLILSMYDIPINHSAVVDLRESLQGSALG
jgi:small GTP-binding protein